jgi:hypothetical protein
LDETHTAFSEAAGEQTLTPKILGHRMIETVEFAGGVAFGRNVLSFRHGHLHAEREFEGIEPSLQRGIGAGGAQMILILLADQIELHALQRRGEPRIANVFTEIVRVAPSGPELDRGDAPSRLLLTQTHIVIHFSRHRRFLAQLWKLAKRFNPVGYAAEIVDFFALGQSSLRRRIFFVAEA